MANSMRAVVMAVLAAAAVTGPAAATAFAAPGFGPDADASYRSPLGDHTRLAPQDEAEQDVTRWFRGLPWGFGGSRQDDVDTDEQTNPGNTDQQTNPGNTDQQTNPGNTDQQTNPGNTDQQTNPGNTDQQTNPGNTDQQTNPGNTDQQTNPGAVDEDQGTESSGATSAGQDLAQRR
ncbi:hypothetical protein [Nocardia sp. X0981]